MASNVMFPLLYLEFELLFKKERFNLTPQDENIRLSCKSNATMNFIAGTLASGTAVGAVSWKLCDRFRILLQSGVMTISGMWMLDRSLFSSAEQILKLDGSILQKELAKIVVTKYQKFPELMQLVSKHFYSERIFDDSTSNNPKLRWRHRNFFSDHDYEDFFSDHDNDSYDKTQGDCHNDSYNNSQGESENVNDRRTNLETKHNFQKAGPHIMADLDPLDCLFGYDAPVEEIHLPNNPNKPSGTYNRRYRRYHRRHRMQNHDAVV